MSQPIDYEREFYGIAQRNNLLFLNEIRRYNDRQKLKKWAVNACVVAVVAVIVAAQVMDETNKK